MTQHFISSIGYSSTSSLLELAYIIYLFILKALKLTMLKNKSYNLSLHIMVSTKNATMYSGMQAKVISYAAFFSFLCHIQSSLAFSISSPKYLSVFFFSSSTTISLVQFILYHQDYFRNLLSHVQFRFHSAAISRHRYEHIILLATDLEESL